MIANLFAVGLGLALFTGISRVARAEPGRVVASPTSRAVTSLRGAVPAERVHCGGALDKAAVGAAETVVTLASVVVLGVPRIVVLGRDVLTGIVGDVVTRELLEALARAVPRAVIRARRAAAPLSPEAVVA